MYKFNAKDLHKNLAGNSTREAATDILNDRKPPSYLLLPCSVPLAPLMDTGRQPENLDVVGDSHWAALGKKHWSKPVNSRKIKNEVIKTELWDVLEQENFEYRSLVILESLQLLEK